MDTKEFYLLTLMISKIVQKNWPPLLGLNSSQVGVIKRVKTKVPFFEG
jgi:hypothetical protein